MNSGEMLPYARFVPPPLITALMLILLRCGGTASANDGPSEPSTHDAHTALGCADKCASMVGDFVRHATPAEIQGAVRSGPLLRTSLVIFCKVCLFRSSTGMRGAMLLAWVTEFLFHIFLRNGPPVYHAHERNSNSASSQQVAF